MRMEKRQFRIGQLAQILQVEQFVIRFWEKEFDLPTPRSNGGQRFYNEKDLMLFNKIKHLLYEGGFTIAGAKKQLKNKKNIFTSASRASFDESLKSEKCNSDYHKKCVQDLIVLQKQLIRLRTLL